MMEKFFQLAALICLLSFLIISFAPAQAADTGSAQCSSISQSEQPEEEGRACGEEGDRDQGDLDVQSRWEKLEKDKTQQDIKKKCGCENDPKVLKDDGETSYFYRLMKCRSECKI
ncbi:MAG: hypothetical protein KJ017_07570 [Alphaproteobacteria bacterium]|nr:hypothetical protein [Alphaproteobacteria bacterium]